MKSKLPRLVIWGGLLAVLAAAIVYALRPQPIQVDLAGADISLLRVTIDEEGEARVRDVYTLYAPLSGYMHRIEAEAGDEVAADVTELAMIEPAPPAFLDVRTEAEQQAAMEAAVAARNLAAAELSRAQADLAFATSELERANRLIQQSIIPERTLDDARRAHAIASANLEMAQAALAVREHELEQAQSRLLTRAEILERTGACECVPITAPVNGVVLRVQRRSEGVVEAGTPLLDIGNPGDLEVVVSLLSEDAVRIERGHDAIISGWGGPDLAAIVQRIEPFGETEVSALGIEEQRVDVVLDLADPPEHWARLGHGYRVDVHVILFEDEVLRVPLGSLIRHGDGWAVYVDDDGTARLQPVEVGQRNSLHVGIVGGLAEGQQVVLFPGDRIADGASIERR